MPDQPSLLSVSAQIVADFQAGKDREKNFEFIFRACQRSVAGYFIRNGVAPDEARDLTQEAFLIVYESSASLRDPASFRSWLFAISRNLLLRHFGRGRRIVSLPYAADADSSAGDPLDRIPDPAPGALDRALDRERRSKLRDALEELPQQMRACVKLSVVEELAYSEIARRLGLSVNTVKVHIHRARRNLSERLGPLFSGGEASGS